MNIIETAIGWLSPPLCLGCGDEGYVLCEGCSTSEVIPFGSRCWRCGALSDRSRTCKSCRYTGAPRYVWISTDYEGMAKKLVSVYKFGHLRAAANQIATLMTDTFLAFNSDEQILKANYVVAPIPTSAKRLRERSFGHAELLAGHIARKLDLKYYKTLGRLGHERQLGSSRATRIDQAAGTYYVRRSGVIKDRNILLVDDVITTGATMASAARILRAAGARHVDGLVFAKRR